MGLADFGRLSAADILITDDGIEDSARDILADQVGELIVVTVDSSGTTPGSAGARPLRQPALR